MLGEVRVAEISHCRWWLGTRRRLCGTALMKVYRDTGLTPLYVVYSLFKIYLLGFGSIGSWYHKVRVLSRLTGGEGLTKCTIVDLRWDRNLFCLPSLRNILHIERYPSITAQIEPQVPFC